MNNNHFAGHVNESRINHCMNAKVINLERETNIKYMYIYIVEFNYIESVLF